jgi:cold-inducible RNA-binding protein
MTLSGQLRPKENYGTSIFAVLNTVDSILQRLDVPSIRPGNEPGFLCSELPGKTLGGQKVPSKLYVGNLAYSVSNDDLQELFAQVGQVQSAAVVTDKFSGQSKGFGFVEMSTAEEAANAIRQFDNSELKGRNIKVNEAKPRESSFGGGNRNRNDGGGVTRGRNRW